jgi:hypothetical protein
MDDEICANLGQVCSPERDSQGRGLCITLKCEKHSDCTSGACLADGSCGSREDLAGNNGAQCTR